MSVFQIYLVALICIIHNAKSVNIDKGSDIIEMVERQYSRLAALEEMVGKLWKENSELKELVKEQQSRILELEEKSETSIDKIKGFDGQISLGEDVISKTMASSYDKLETAKAKNRNTINKAHQNDDKIRETRLLEGSVNPTIQPTTVAFYAYMSKSDTITPHYTIIFDHIETNLGGGYSQHSGAFTVPITGVYMLTYTFFPGTAGSYASIQLAVNSIARGAIFIDSSSGDSDLTGSTGNVVLSLNQGDVCIVRTHPTYKSRGTIESDQYMRCSFSGVLISQ